MKKKEILIIVLCAALAVSVLSCRLVIRTGAVNGTGIESEPENTEGLVTGVGVVYGEVTAVGEETLTIRLGIPEEEEANLRLTGGEVAIRTKAETAIERVRMETAYSAVTSGKASDAADEEDDFAVKDLSEGDVVSIALDEDGYAETITLMNFFAVSMEGDEENG